MVSGKFIALLLMLTVWQWSGAALAASDIQWVELKLESGENVRAALGVVGGSKRPAVIFNHGTGVRHYGHKGAIAKGNMDVTKYVRALNEMGYTAIAPIRKHNKNFAYVSRGSPVGSNADWTEVVEEGMQVSASARAFLGTRSEVDSGRIAIMGFSEGGNVTLWSATSQKNFRAVVLLSPATIDVTKKYALKKAATKSNLKNITVPVFVGVGRSDHKSIRKVLERRLIPNLQKLGVELDHHPDYPGGHDWFYRPRDALKKDVKAFLARHLG